MHALFVDLLPPDAGIADPCEVLLVTTGTRGGVEAPLVLLDRQLAAASEPARLQPLADLAPTSLRFEGEVPAQVVEALASLGVKATVEDPDAEPWQIADYGRWTRQLLLNGLVLAAGPVGACTRPGYVALAPGDLEQLRFALSAHAETIASTWEESPPARSLAVTLTGDAWFRHPWTLRRAIGAVLDSPCHLAGLRLVDPTPDALLTALEEALCAELQQPGLDGVGVALSGPPSDPIAAAIAAEIQGARVDPGLLDRAGKHLTREPDQRRADDRTRAAVFRALQADHHRHREQHRNTVTDQATQVLGPPSHWINGYHRHLRTSAARVVLLPTWQCELRCGYCAIQKVDAKEMPLAVADRSLDLLFSAPTEEVQLAFFGGEPFLRWDLLQHACASAQRRADAEGRQLRIQVTTNAWAITEGMVAELSAYDITFQLSIDGTESTQNNQRKARHAGDSYARGPGPKLPWFKAHRVRHSAFMVVPPAATTRMVGNFQHLVDLGFESIQLNYAIGAPWEPDDCRAFADGLLGISGILEQAWGQGQELEMVNLSETVRRIRNNLHVTVDFDGRIYGGNAFLVQTADRDAFALGHLDDGHGWHRYMVDGRSDKEVFAHWKRRASVQVTQRIGAVEADFVTWMQGRHPERLGGRRRQAL